MNAPWPDSRPRGRKGGRKFALSKAQARPAPAAMVHRDTSVSVLCILIPAIYRATRGGPFFNPPRTYIESSSANESARRLFSWPESFQCLQHPL